MICEFCGYDFDGAAGRYGCPNCLGEGLDMEPMVSIPKWMQVVTQYEVNRLLERQWRARIYLRRMQR